MVKLDDWTKRERAIRAQIDAELRARKVAPLGKGAGDYLLQASPGRPSYYGGVSRKPYVTIRALYRRTQARTFRECNDGSFNLAAIVDALIDVREICAARDAREEETRTRIAACDRVLPALRKRVEKLDTTRGECNITQHDGRLQLTIDCPAEESGWLADVVLEALE